MSQPPNPAVDGRLPSFPPPDPAGVPVPPPPEAVTPDAGEQWTTPPAPSWAQPWEPPGVPATPEQPVAGPPKPARSSSRLVLVLVAVVAALVGAVAAALLVTAVLLGSAKDIGEEIGAAVAPAVKDSISDGLSDGMAQSMEDAMAFAEEGILTEETGSVEQFPATEPGDLGPDPVLDAYADNCFAGELQACDDLYYSAPPLSDYEEYGSTCGGRVKAYMLSSCTELD